MQEIRPENKPFLPEGPEAGPDFYRAAETRPDHKFVDPHQKDEHVDAVAPLIKPETKPVNPESHSEQTVSTDKVAIFVSRLENAKDHKEKVDIMNEVLSAGLNGVISPSEQNEIMSKGHDLQQAA